MVHSVSPLHSATQLILRRAISCQEKRRDSSCGEFFAGNGQTFARQPPQLASPGFRNSFCN